MYDSYTENLINFAPKFGDLDLERLPRSLTDDYTKIVSFRLSINEGAISEDDSEAIQTIQKSAQRIALTYEAYLAGNLNVNKNLKKAAAFVSASAHQVWMMADKVRFSKIVNGPYLNASFIHPHLSCAILFFISGYTADAAEVAKDIQIDNEENTENYLVKNIKNLLSGRVTLPLSNDLDLFDDNWGHGFVVDVLWKIINEGLVTIINLIAGSAETDSDNFQSAIKNFEKVKELASDNINIHSENFNLTLNSTLVGPRHLAILLKALADEISEIALVKIPAPTNIDKEHWITKLREFAKKRPYLWPNHLDAIRSGYLEIGTSSVMSFPTGGGKSTLAELKISVALLNKKSVIFIAPTLALVDQISKNLHEAFPTVKTMFDMSEFGLESIEIEELPDISVMTPESCLVRMSFNPEIFSNVGLFIFDECHLLHPKNEEATDRRSIDSMLCLMRILELSPDTDILLMSAMMRNSPEIAGWINDISGKNTLPLTISWKPTRQAKGCVIYESDRITELYEFIQKANRTPTGKLTAAAKRALTATPFSFFSLNQTWHSMKIEDYRMVKLLGSMVTLSINDTDRITPNKNHVASEIGRQADLNNIKTIIFTDTKTNCDAIIKNDCSRTDPLELTSYEQSLLSLVSQEFGGDNYSYVSQNVTFLPHHGLLTKIERALHESLFKRKGGVDVIVATSTLAQGMNLPAEIVIIAGNTRYDAVAGQQQEIDAHDLLNAAGRAGRAGESARGLVLVIPSRIVTFNPKNNKISKFFMQTIKEVFSETDQCLDIQDPIKTILDKIHTNQDIDEKNISYFIERIPHTTVADFSTFMSKTLGAYQAKIQNDQKWISTRIESANVAFRRIRNLDDGHELSWHEKLAAASGTPAKMIHDLADELSIDLDEIVDFNSALNWLFLWLGNSLERIETILRSGNIDDVFGNEYTSLDTQDKQKFFTQNILELCLLWVNAEPLSKIEEKIRGGSNNLGKCDKARKFALRLIPEIAYSAGVFSQVYLNLLSETGKLNQTILEIEMMSPLIKNGFTSPQALALNHILKNKGDVSRVNTNRVYTNIIPFITPAEDANDYGSVIKAINTAYEVYTAFDLDF